MLKAELYTLKWWTSCHVNSTSIKPKRSRVDQPVVSGCLSLPMLRPRTPLSKAFMFPTEQSPKSSEVEPPWSSSFSALSFGRVGGRGRDGLTFWNLHFSGSAHQNLARTVAQGNSYSAKGVWIFMTTHMRYVYYVSTLFAFVLIIKIQFIIKTSILL